ncbi:MAG: ABC transporter ATP-binding protein [Lachnospiraceae bacterium]|jgi:peptide/nickel transport system ATP-binding protein|nr:ABC transporter ATP-binding protein [Lachnospiraceae bacterium]
MGSVLEISDLCVEFHTQNGVAHAVNHVDLSIGEKRSVGLVGETGAGKTTTALSIMQLIDLRHGKYTSGRIDFRGDDLMKLKDTQLQKIRGKEISMIFQDPMTTLNPVIKVQDQIAESYRIHEKDSPAEALIRAKDMLEMVGIPAGRGEEYPHQFSGGMKQRVVIAMALTCNPQLLLADEPTTALDVTIQSQVLDMINDLKDRLGTSMLLITHDLGIVAETCDEVAIMYAGEIIEAGALRQIFKDFRHPYTDGLFNSIPSLTKKTHRLMPIPGLMPDPKQLPGGCHFHPRCPHAVDECKVAHPEMTEVEKGHLVRCLRCTEVLSR